MNSLLIDTPLGVMRAIGDEESLHRLEFADCSNLEKNSPGKSAPLLSIQKELEKYFKGHLHEFKTPITLNGSHFQKKLWLELKKIPLGKLCSYSEIATAIGHPAACRAVGQAAKSNPIAIIIPCHRVIQSNGALGGYNGGLDRKKWLLAFEKISPEKY